VLLKPLTANESHDESNIEGKQGDDVQDESEGAKRAGAQSLDIKASLVSEHEEVDPSAVVEGELKASRATIISIDGEGLEGGGGPVSPTVSLADAESWEEDFELLRFEVVAHMQLEKAYFADQDRQLKAIRERIDAAISSFAHFRDFALRRLEMLDREIRDYDITYESSTTAWPAKFGVCEVASVQVACMSYLAANQRLANQGNGMRKVLEKDILPVVKREIERLQYAKKEMVEDETTHRGAVREQREKCNIAWKAYEDTKRVWKGKIQYPAKGVKNQQILNQQDRESMIAYNTYQSSLRRLQSLYGEYSSFVLGHIERFSSEDIRRITRLRHLMVLYSNAQINFHRTCISAMQDTIQMCETIEPEENHNKFSLDAKVSILKEAYDPTDSKSVKKVEHLLPPERDKDTAERLDSLEIMKIGTMYYRFVTVGIKTWRPVFILLSGRGILHVFQSEDEEKPMMTIGLHYCTINLAPSVHPNAFRIMEAKPSITGGEKIAKHCLRTGQQGTMAEWMVALKQFIPSQTVEITQKEMKKFHRMRVSEAIRKGRIKKN